MKKYFSGIAAVLLAIVAMSFTAQRSTKIKSSLTSYHWFENNEQNDADLGSIVPGIYRGFGTKDDMIENEFETCIGVNTPPFCAVGYNPSQVTAVSGGYEVKLTEEDELEQPAELEDTKVRKPE